MSFDQLSDELILEIARQAEREYGSNMFLALLVLCSRRLNNVVGPLLYRTFTQSLAKPASLPNLLRMVMEKPAVGAEIKNLVLMEPYFHEGLTLNQHIRNPIGQAHSLEKLRNYSIDHRGPSPRIGIRTILPWCAVLSMHTIRIAMLEQEDDWDPSPFPKQYHVQNLRITNSSVDGMIMRTLLGRFVSLQKFYYHHGSAELTDFIFQAIGEGLAHLHDSLEELVLLGTLRDVLSGDLGREPVGSLAEFTKLRCIGTEAEVLFGPDNYVWGFVRPPLATILPASLEILVLRMCTDEIYHDLRELVRHGKNKVDVLKSVAIDITGVWGEVLNDIEAWRARQKVEQELISEYKNVGIELIFGPYSGNARTSMPSFMAY